MCARLRLPARHLGMLGCCLWLVLAGDQVRSLPRSVWESVLEPGGHHPNRSGLADPSMLSAGTASPHPLLSRYSNSFRIKHLNWSPVTESNRRSSPYHGQLALRPASTD